MEQAVLDGELASYIKAEINKLDDKLRIPLYLYYTDEMSVDAIANLLAVPSGTVKSRLHKARRRLRKQLEVYEYAAD